MSEPTQNLNHIAEMQALLIEQFKRDPGMLGFAKAFGTIVQTLENALWQLYTERGIDSAVGAQLDVLGRIVGYSRGGLTDDLYRLRLRAKIFLNRDSGVCQDILAVFALLLPDNVLTLHELPPAGFELTIGGVIPGTVLVSELASILKAARSACIEAQLVYSLAPVAGTFTYDTGPGYDTGAYAGSSIT